MTERVLRFGFLPLVDAALPIIAHELGLAEREGVRLELMKDMSWATVRDRMLYGIPTPLICLPRWRWRPALASAARRPTLSYRSTSA
jgi:hypothetical protein